MSQVAQIDSEHSHRVLSMNRSRRAMRFRWALIGGHAVAIVALLLGWQLLYAIVGDDVFASPAQTFEAMASKLPDWVPDLRSTLLALFAALAGTVAIGVLLGFVFGLSEFLTEVFRPILVTIYAIPKIAVYPVFLLAFKVSLTTLVLFAIFHGVIPVILLVMEGTRRIPSIYLKLGDVYSMSILRKVRHILLPALSPVVAEGVRMGASLTFLGVIIAEMFGSNSGLGYRLVAYLNLNQTKNILSIFIVISLLGIILSLVLTRWERSVQGRSGRAPEQSI